MHETALVRNLVHRVEKLCAEEQAQRVVEVAVWLGALCHMSPEHFTDHFRQEAAGTCADQAQLRIETSGDINHPNAQDVLLRSLDVETEDEASP
ncbi:hydrogenase/urease maturation nickel metallochaperone HypA [Marinobacter sp. F4218]|uniref:hydrogenase/urease maturation nickel metallochaperone HypA n=1 Tax=Marinobacter sp. F4218 TaxID=2862868 RepID=UPI001C630004|nr:hydrogenase/urease maturation nickel metallochaperone HypA [Marinobacter sp. F4218]MBW7470825.1 hydrogenase maturation nickel metallochaperone HypA [Marinobacter sp. F4218]